MYENLSLISGKPLNKIILVYIISKSTTTEYTIIIIIPITIKKIKKNTNKNNNNNISRKNVQIVLPNQHNWY